MAARLRCKCEKKKALFAVLCVLLHNLTVKEGMGPISGLLQCKAYKEAVSRTVVETLIGCLTFERGVRLGSVLGPV